MNLYKKYMDALEKEKHYTRVRGNVWAKKVKYVDVTKPSGYAFEGEWLPMKDRVFEFDLKEGDILLLSADIGSFKHHEPVVQVWRVTKVGKDDFEYEKLMETSGRDWALKIRDELAKIVNVGLPMPLPTEKRIEELQKEIEKLEEMLKEKKYELEKLKLEEMKKEVV
jgi:hypothetical protein